MKMHCKRIAQEVDMVDTIYRCVLQCTVTVMNMQILFIASFMPESHTDEDWTLTLSVE